MLPLDYQRNNTHSFKLYCKSNQKRYFNAQLVLLEQSKCGKIKWTILPLSNLYDRLIQPHDIA